MINTSQRYKEHLNDNSFSPKSKIVVDNETYLGAVIKTAPKISHTSTSIIGGFPAKTVSFDIYDLNNELDFEDKEIIVFKGLVVDGEVEYIQQGIFIPRKENIQTNISTKTISFKDVQDRTQLLENLYETELDYSDNQKHTGLEIVEEICTKRGLTLKNSDFSFANYEFPLPNFDETTTDRQVISRLAEIGGEIAFFDNDGDLVIKKQNDTEDTIIRKRYEKISEEKTITYNTVVLGKEGINDDIVYPTSIEGERVEYKILDNPFVDLIREDIIGDVASNIIGLTYTPFQLNGFIDGYIYELNDVVEIEDRNGNIVRAVILSLENSSRIKSNIKSIIVNNPVTNYSLAGSNKKEIEKVKLDVDHNKKTIEAEIIRLNETQEQLVQTIMDVNSIQNMFQITGGNNLIKDSQKLLDDEGLWAYAEAIYETNFPSDDEYPSSDSYPLEYYFNQANYDNGYDASLIGKTVSIAKLGISNGRMSTTATNITGLIVNNMYSLSYKISNDENTVARVKLIGNGNVVYEATFEEAMVMEEQTTSFVAQTSNYTLEIQSTSKTNGFTYIYDLMLNKGDIQSWEPASGETVSTVLKMSQLGLQIYCTGSDIATLMTAQGFEIRRFQNGTLFEVITKFTSDGLTTKKATMQELDLSDFEFKTINYQGNKTLILYKKEEDS